MLKISHILGVGTFGPENRFDKWMRLAETAGLNGSANRGNNNIK